MLLLLLVMCVHILAENVMGKLTRVWVAAVGESARDRQRGRHRANVRSFPCLTFGKMRLNSERTRPRETCTSYSRCTSAQSSRSSGTRSARCSSRARPTTRSACGRSARQGQAAVELALGLCALRGLEQRPDVRVGLHGQVHHRAPPSLLFHQKYH